MAWTGSGQGFSGHNPDSKFQNRSCWLSLDCQPARQWPLLSSCPQGLGREQVSSGECSLWVLEISPQGLDSVPSSVPLTHAVLSSSVRQRSSTSASMLPEKGTTSCSTMREGWMWATWTPKPRNCLSVWMRS